MSREKQVLFSEAEICTINEYTDRILEIIDHANEFTRSDLQGAAMGVVLSIRHELKKELQTTYKK